MAKKNKIPENWARDLDFPDIVSRSRIRLARNLEGVPFPGNADEKTRLNLRNNLCKMLKSQSVFKGGSVVMMNDVTPIRRAELLEERLISPELADKKDSGAVVFNRKHNISVMINEEDHICMQIVRNDVDFLSAWADTIKLDDSIDAAIPYAYDKTLGYLTACPSNIGTGMRVSVMLNLLGLRLSGELDQTLHALDDLGIEARGFWGESTENPGHFFQLSNRHTLGDTEEELIGYVSGIAKETAIQEQNARLRLMETGSDIILDCAARALAVLKNARLLRADEAFDFFSAVAMCAALGVIRGVKATKTLPFAMKLLPGAIQAAAHAELGMIEQDKLRAKLASSFIEDATINDALLS